MTRIYSAGFGAYHHRLLSGWAFSDIKAKGRLLRDIAIARIEANKPIIDEKLRFYVGLYKLSSVEVLLDRIELATKAGISEARLHEQLAAEAGIEAAESEEES